LLHVLPSAANLQQILTYGLKHLPGPGVVHADCGARWSEQSASTSCKRRSKSLISIARTKVSTTAAIVAVRRQNAFDADPHGGRVVDERQLDGLVRQRLGLAREQMRRRRSSSCCGSRPGGRQGCPTGPFRTAARAPAPAVLV